MTTIVKRRILTWAIALLVVIINLHPGEKTAASMQEDQDLPGPATPAELIAAVNNLRISRGLNPLAVHPILMSTAQQQADALLASGGAVGHTRPNGMSYTEQLLRRGYPLAGDLSLGGYRAENITWARPDMTVEDIINLWLGDAPHTNTMLSPYYEDIGAGVAMDQEGNIFYVIDCAMPTPSRTPQAYTPVSGSSGANNGEEEIRYIQPVILATARPDGDVVHEVRYGQSLWSIAIAYGSTIDWIQRYNGITDNTIYTGQRLLVKKSATQPAPSATAASTGDPERGTAAPSITPSPTGTPTASPHPTASPAPLEAVQQASGLSTTVYLVGFFLVSMLLGGLITWLSDRRQH